MSRDITCTLGQLGGLISRDMARLQKNVDKAIARTTKRGVKPIRDRVPVAFGELSDSVQDYSKGSSGNPCISVDAPHAGWVEIGSPPHTPDFASLLAWVKLRGLQGLSSGKHRGSTTARQSRRVASMLSGHVVNGSYSPTDAPEKVARAISRGIEKHGTKPHWFVRSSLGEIRQILDEELRRAKEDTIAGTSSPGGGSSSSRGGRGPGSRGGNPNAATERLALHGKSLSEKSAVWAGERAKNSARARKNFGHDK